MSKCDECNLGYIDFGNCFQCKGNTCEKEVRADEREKVLKEVANWCRENDIQCRKKIDGIFIEFSVSEIVNDFKSRV